MTDSESLKPGTRLGRYELIQPIAKGGMASVWAARLVGTRGFQKVVAVKAMLPALREELDAEAMFLAEARLAARIQHPNVGQVIDLGDEGGCLYLVMEWIHGAALTSVISAAAKQGGIPLPIAVRIVRQVCDGLHAAHTLTDEQGTPLGLVHRDVSPHNVLVGFNGITKVVDFGIAKVRAGAGHETRFGQVKGKLAYMAPEQLHFEALDQRTDIFAVGILLYLMTTGVHPFKHDEEHETALALCSLEPPRAPSTFIDGYPVRLEQVVLRALAKKPGDRYATAEEFERDLAKALPPSSKGPEVIQDYLRGLLPDAYQQGIDLARNAMNPFVPATASSSFSDLAILPKTRSNSTLRAVAVSARASPLESITAASRGGSPTMAADERGDDARARRGWLVPALLGALALAVSSVVGVMGVNSRSKDPIGGSRSVSASGTPASPILPSMISPAPAAAPAPSPVPSAAPLAATVATPSSAAPTLKLPGLATGAAANAPHRRFPVVAKPLPKKPGPGGLKDPYGR